MAKTNQGTRTTPLWLVWWNDDAPDSQDSMDSLLARTLLKLHQRPRYVLTDSFEQARIGAVLPVLNDG